MNTLHQSTAPFAPGLNQQNAQQSRTPTAQELNR